MDKNEFIKILPAYIGCKVKHAKSSADNIYGLYPDGMIFTDTMEILEVGEYKLLLRPLSSLTETEKKEVIYMTVQLAGIKDVDEQWIASTKVIRYLNSIGIDTDGLLNTEYAEEVKG
jgi:hypothetical protein